jgi:hypothetical protein
MLLIENIDKICGELISDDWCVYQSEIVGDVQYQFSVEKLTTSQNFTIQVERLPIGEKKLIYEVWAWKSDGNIIRKMVDIDYFKDYKDFLKVLESIVLNYNS